MIFEEKLETHVVFNINFASKKIFSFLWNKKTWEKKTHTHTHTHTHFFDNTIMWQEYDQ